MALKKRLKVLKVINVVKEKPREDIPMLVRELKVIKQNKSSLEKREKEILVLVNEYIDSTANKDGKGNRFYKTSDDFGNPLVLKREARKSYKLDEERLKGYLQATPELLNRVFTSVTVEKFDENELDNLVAEELMTMEEVKMFTEEKIVYATTFPKQEELDEMNAKQEQEEEE